MSWLTVLAATASCYLLFTALGYIYRTFVNNPLHHLPGPPLASYLWGNMKELMASDAFVVSNWIEKYGKTITFAGLGGDRRLVTTDHRAINHVLMNSTLYQKPHATTWSLGRVTGFGVLVVEGEKHKQQRRIMNPAFGPQQIRELTGIFVEKSAQLRDLWSAECSKTGGTATIDALAWLSRMTLDVIGEAGFHYQFGNLTDGHPSELNQAFAVAFEASTNNGVAPFLQAWFPIFRALPLDSKRNRVITLARDTISRIGNALLADSKAALNGTGEKDSSWAAKDLLSLLVRANMSKDLHDNQRMNDEDVIAQITTMIVAGHETTSTATTWALFALTQHLGVQDKLRKELLSVSTEDPTMEDLNALPYLDQVVRETLRVHAPVPATMRYAVQDDIIPLQEPFTDRNGKVHDSIRVKKGQNIVLPILTVNIDKSVWGSDAKEFRPERWESPPEAASSIPGVWGNMMSFLGGPRSCIGYRFSLVEMKALLFVLIRTFEFELAVPIESVSRKSRIVQRPVIKPDGRNEMPLIIKPVSN